jgi:hypothetical protein
MEDQNTVFISSPKQQPWNKGKFTGAKLPLRPKHVWSIRSRLQAEGRTRDLAMFNLAINSKLRACDVVALKIEDISAQRLCGRPRYHPSKEDRAACSV